MRRRRELVFHIAELDRLLALSEATRRVVRDGYRNPRLRDCERIVDPDSGEHVWRITFQVSRRRKENRKQT